MSDDTPAVIVMRAHTFCCDVTCPWLKWRGEQVIEDGCCQPIISFHKKAIGRANTDATFFFFFFLAFMHGTHPETKINSSPVCLLNNFFKKQLLWWTLK